MQQRFRSFLSVDRNGMEFQSVNGCADLWGRRINERSLTGQRAVTATLLKLATSTLRDYPQVPTPEQSIPHGMADASFLAHIVVAKFCDHIPPYCQAEWLGHVAWLLASLVELIARHVMAGRGIHADDTPVDVLAPGTGKIGPVGSGFICATRANLRRIGAAGRALSLHSRRERRALPQ